MDQAQLVSAGVTLAVLALVVRRTLRTQTVRVWSLIAVPLLTIGIAGTAVTATPPASLAAALSVVAAGLAGAALGYARSVHSTVGLGPRPGTLVVRGNLVLAAILIAAFAVRFVVRSLVGSGGGVGITLTDALIVFAAAAVAVARGLLFFTWRRLVATGAAL